MRLLLLAKNGRNANWYGLFHSHNYLKWDNFCHYEWKFKIKEEWNMYCTEKKTNFHIQSERDSQCTYILLSIYTLSPYHFKTSGLVHDVFFLYLRNLDIIKYTKLTTLFILLVLHSPEKNSQLRHWLINWGKGCKRNLFSSIC